MHYRILTVLAASMGSLCASPPAIARVTRLHIDSRAPLPAKPGLRAYELIQGTFEGELDPTDRRNRLIVDLDGAARNAAGKVAYSATFSIARPLERGSGVLFHEVPNRGYGSVAADEDGHIRVMNGWQGDVAPKPGMNTITVPVATGRTGPAFVRFTNMPIGTTTLPLMDGLGALEPRPLPVTLDTTQARLFRQGSDAEAPTDIAAADFAFADCREIPFPGKPDSTRLCLKGGFDPHYAYGLAYQGKDPLVLGIGFAATRDFNSFLRHARKDDAGMPNPLAGEVRHAVSAGVSQSGNFLKTFLNLGFNEDEQGRRVFDGLNPHIAARQVPLNVRFGLPGGAAGLYELGSEGTLWWSRYDDRVRGHGKHSLLDRCRATHTCPRIMETFGSAELWGLRMSPALVGTDARADVPLSGEVRRYYFPGVTHGGSQKGGISLQGDSLNFPGAPKCLLPGNPNPVEPTRRALLKRLVAWVAERKPPPPSRYPRLQRGELVEPTAEAMGWPAIPGVPVPTAKMNLLPITYAGPGYSPADVSGVIESLPGQPFAFQPPQQSGMLPARVPRVDADGNETGDGVPSVQFLVPLGTYLGWNVLGEGYGAGGQCYFMGGFIPFAATRAQRLAQGDPRLSLEERYGSHEGFVARLKAVAAERVRGGWLLPDDAARLVTEAEASAVLRQSDSNALMPVFHRPN